LVGGDGQWAPVRFDGMDVLSSADFVNVDGSLTAGARAWQLAAGAAERFEPAPLRVAGRPGRWWWLGVPVGVWDMVTATLTVVAGRARAQVGGVPVDEVRLVVRASWGPNRRRLLREAAWRADLGQPELVVAPAAVAAHAASGGVALRVGSFVAVCDVDAGVEACGAASWPVRVRGVVGDRGPGCRDDGVGHDPRPATRHLHPRLGGGFGVGGGVAAAARRGRPPI